MGPSALVLDALSPAGRGAAYRLASRGKDLVLCGEMPSMLEELAAELRVVHGVEIRTCVADLASEAAIAEIVQWIDSHAVAVDRLLLPRWESADPVRASQMKRHAAALQEALHGAFRRAGVEANLRFLSSAPTRPPSAVPARERKRTAMMEAPRRRPRKSTRPGHADPSSSAPPA